MARMDGNARNSPRHRCGSIAVALGLGLSLGLTPGLATPAKAEGAPSAPVPSALEMVNGSAASSGGAGGETATSGTARDPAAPQDPGTAPQASPTFVVRQNMPAVIVPYGVDVPSWLNTAQRQGLLFSMASWDHESVGDCFDDGRALVLRDGAPYPAVTAEGRLSDFLDWGAVRGDDVTTPSITDLDARVTLPRMPSTATDVPPAPSEALSSLEMREWGATHAVVVGTREDGSAYVWQDARDRSLHVGDAGSDAAWSLSDTYQLLPDGAFASRKAGERVALGALNDHSAYIKLGDDITAANPVTGARTSYERGQVLRVPIVQDTRPPAIVGDSLSVVLASGDAIQEDTCWISRRTLTTDSGGIKLSVRVDDAAVPDPNPNGEEVSGVDGESAVLEIGGKTVQGSVAGGTATFVLSGSTLDGEGTYDLNAATVRLADVAGNHTAARLSALLAASGDPVVSSISKLRILPPPSMGTSVSLVATGDDDDPTNEDGSVSLSNAPSVSVALTVHDALFSQLSSIDGWAPLAVKVDGAEVAVSPGSLTRVRGERDTYACKLPAITEEGRHTVEVTYSGAAAKFKSLVPMFAGAFPRDAVSFTIDRTAPEVTAASVRGGIDKDRVGSLGSQGSALVTSEATIDLVVDDAPGAGAQVASGVSESSATVTRLEGPDATSGDQVSLGPLSQGQAGSYALTLDEDGCYPLSDIRVTVADCAGNKRTVSLADVAGASDWGISAIAVESSAPVSEEEGLSYGFTVHTDDPDQVRRVSDGRSFFPPASSVSFAVKDFFMRAIVGTPGFGDCFSATRTMAGVSGEGVPDIAFGPDGTSRFEAVEGRSGWYQLEVPFSEGDLPDGWYTADFRGRFLWPKSSTSFGVDTTSPQVSDATYGGGKTIATLDDGSRVLVGTSRAVRVRLQDLFPRALGQTADESGMNEAGTSGIDTSSVRVSVSRSDGLGSAAASSEELWPQVGDDGWIQLDLSDEGLYALDGIRIEASDECGNHLSTTLADYAASLSDAEREQDGWGFSSILVDKGTNVSLSAQVVDGSETPAAMDPHYHRGPATIRVSVTDPWLPVYRALDADKALVAGTVSMPGASARAVELKLSPSSFAQVDDSKAAWAASVELPKAEGASWPREGEYQVKVMYWGNRRALEGQAPLSQDLSFGVDYTAPKLGVINFSQTSPFPTYDWGEHHGDPWGWVFSADTEMGRFSVSDNLSGVNAKTLVARVNGDVALETGCDTSEDGLSGEAWLSFAGDGKRMALDGSTVGIADVAGNMAGIASLAQPGATNLPEGSTDITIDTVAPVMSVSYDNNDARNGKYYNAARTATFTVSESSFDLLATYAPNTRIAAAYRDGSDYPAAALAAKDFSPVTLDDGSVAYMGSIECKDDANWHIEASFTDPAGHASNAISDDFVVDTTAPLLMVSYDNDDVANGMYYKAPRTATVTVNDRNFSSELGSVDATATAGGTSPVVSGWSETEQGKEWQATAAFAGETHYQLKVAVSDLAGNVSESYDSGEFVIDMTNPVIQISGVADNTAYAGDVAPAVEFSDTNLDELGSGFELSGARTGAAYFDGRWETSTGTDKRTGFSSTPVDPGYDDVYTYMATGADLAGNTTTQAVRFSVNRFGSTYYLVGDSQGIVGTYLDKPQDVQVVEVNVSGLDTSASRVSLAEDDRSRTLSAGQDYTLAPNEDDAGWSATTYTLPARLFKQDGFYRLTLTSTDSAGNLSQNTMEGKGADREGDFPVSFAVDTTKPTAGLMGVQDGATYLNPSMTAQADGSDNLGLCDMQVYMDGTKVGSWDSSQGTGPISVKLPADDETHSYRVVSRDFAGNTAEAVYKDVRVTSSLLDYVASTPELLSAVVGGFIVSAGVVAAAVVLARRRHAANADRRNPFGH